jgi:hypothetical protein
VGILEVAQCHRIAREAGRSVDSEHCALWAANTLKEAIRDYLAMKKERGRRLIANVESGWR